MPSVATRTRRRKVEFVTPYRPRNWTSGFHKTKKRWITLVLHRRAGKTTGILNHHQRYCVSQDLERARLRYLVPDLSERQLAELLRRRNYGHILPTYKQAKLTAWEMLKFYARSVPGVKFNETELTVKYPSGARLSLFGADNPEALRGTAFSGLSFDEYGLHPPNIFSEVLSKSLADHLGYAIFAGTIKGKNQLWKSYQAGTKGPHAEDYFTVWQDIDYTLEHEQHAATTMMLRQALEDDKRLVASGEMSEEEFEQEWYLSVDAAIQGAYYTKVLHSIRKKGQITRVPVDPALPVDTDWDLGINDKMSIVFSQSLRSGEIHIVDYYQNSGFGLDHYANVLRDKGYVYGEHWAPHDIKVRELSTGRSRRSIARDLGIDFNVGRQHELADAIIVTRAFLARCWFNEGPTDELVECLQHYKQARNEQTQEYTGKPVHDWASHGADAFRGLAMRHKIPGEAGTTVPDEMPTNMGGGWLG